MDVIDLTRELVSRPSYVTATMSERAVAEFIEQYLNGLGRFTVTRQFVEGERFNVIAHDGHPARLVFCCHMDTVQPSGNWEHKMLAGEIVDDNLYGLGAADMKGGLACVLDAVARAGKTKGLWLLFDVDEEYEFKGMARFLEEFGTDPHLRPEFAVFPEPGSDIRNGHRGVIELHLRVRGASGHAARPHEGKNAILGATHAVEHLIKGLNRQTDPQLGRSSCNLAVLQGGIDSGIDAEGNVIVGGGSPNKIPDVAELKLDIRPAAPGLRASNVIAILKSTLEQEGYNLEVMRTVFDRQPFFIKRERLRDFRSIVRTVSGTARFANLRGSGYTEAGMFHERLGADCVIFGPGPDTFIHKVDEYVSITQLRQVREIFSQLIDRYCGSASAARPPRAAVPRTRAVTAAHRARRG